MLTLNISKILAYQNLIITLALGFHSIHYLKLFQCLKILIGIPYKYIHFKSRNYQYFMIEICYILNIYIGTYLLLYTFNYYYGVKYPFNIPVSLPLFTRINIPLSLATVLNNMYNNCFIYSAAMLPLASFLNQDRFNNNDILNSVNTLIHLENGYLFLLIHNHNLKNNINTNTNHNLYYNLLQCIAMYFIWLYTYNIIMNKNLKNNNPKISTVQLFCNNNIQKYNMYHILLSIPTIILGYYCFDNIKLQSIIFGISYLGVSLFTGM